MTTSTTVLRDDSIHEITKMVNNAPNKLSVFQLIRVSRIKLGSALERLENFEPSPTALDQLHEHAENIACEIDALVRSIQQFTGR
jgi:hypothetical protein